MQQQQPAMLRDIKTRRHPWTNRIRSLEFIRVEWRRPGQGEDLIPRTRGRRGAIWVWEEAEASSEVLGKSVRAEALF